jgi:UDP-glucuronate decarboxylase
MKRILVTGGAGFVGSHLCKRLLEENNKVICLDNFYTGSRDNIINLLLNKNFELITHDVQNIISLEVDEIYNLACPASPPHYQFDPISTTKTSILGAINMLDIARKCKAKILQASTSEVYGDPKVHPQPETYNGNVSTTGIRACYDEGKRCAETLFFDYKRQYDVEIKVVRIFNTYGPSMNLEDGRVVSNFIIQALRGEDITIYGNGKQTRSFQYIDDLIDGMLKLMKTKNDFTGPVNIGNPDEFTMIELAKIILRLTNSNSKLVYKDLPQDDPLQRKPSIDLAKKELNWEPKVKLERGLEETIKYFRKVL